MDEIEKNNGEIIIYQTEDGRTQLEVRLENENVWLSQQQIANLFGVQRPAITKHLKNIFESGELEENSVSSILEHTASDGKNYKTQFYMPSYQSDIESTPYKPPTSAAGPPNV